MFSKEEIRIERGFHGLFISHAYIVGHQGEKDHKLVYANNLKKIDSRGK
jgi:hypothetical protein